MSCACSLADPSVRAVVATQPRKLSDGPDSSGDSATVSHGGKSLTVSFIGAAAGSQPCDASYSLIATSDENAVAITIVEHPVAAPATTICTAVGYVRSATVSLASGNRLAATVDRESPPRAGAP
jgi:hypothetical protein